MKVIFLHQYFYPEVAGAAIRLTELAVGLRQKGFDITVLTGSPNYEAKRNAPRKERYRGLTIERLPKIRLNKNSRLGRALSALSYFFAAFVKLLFADRKAILVIGTDPPFLPLLGWLMNRIRSQSFIILTFDIYPDIAVQLGHLRKGTWIIRLWEVLNSISFSKAKAIVTLGEQMRQALLEKLPKTENGSNLMVIPTWEDGEWIRPLLKTENWFCQKYDLVEKTVVLYSGNIGLAHDLVSVIEAAELLQDHRDLFFLLIGDGAQRNTLVQLATQKKLRNIRFLPYQPMETIPYSLTAGDIDVISMRPGTEGLCVPSKFQTALAAGAAILGIVPAETEVAEAIARYDLGIQVQPGKPREIAEAILKLHQNQNLLNQLKRNARQCFEAHFTKECALQKYVQLLQQIDSDPTKPFVFEEDRERSEHEKDPSEKRLKEALASRE